MSKIIGYTTGVFDLFHIGHLNLLEKAKANCDYLIVGVSTDEIVQEYKHKRPIIPFEERFRIVEAIKYVDKKNIVDFSDRLINVIDYVIDEFIKDKLLLRFISYKE